MKPFGKGGEDLRNSRLGRRGPAAGWACLLVVCFALGPGASESFSGRLAAQDFWLPRHSKPMPAPDSELNPTSSRREGQSGGIDAVTRLRIDRALEYLYRNQSPEGYWTDRVGRKVHDTYRGKVAPHVGVTALAGMAFLSSGVLPDEGPREKYCVAVRKAIEFVMDCCEPNGFITAHGSRMYSHAFATLFLAEAYGAGFYRDSARLRGCLKRATELIISAQNATGGWRYLPGAEDADMSVTVCQVFALRGARNVGIEVPKATIDAAVRYVKNSFVRETATRGAFQYQIDLSYPGAISRCSFALTAAGVATLFGAGEYSAPEIRLGLQYLWDARPPAGIAPDRFDFYYAHYYAAQAAFQAGGEYWKQWYEVTKRELLALQRPDGSWTDLVGSNYATAMAAIILQIPNQYLPIMEN